MPDGFPNRPKIMRGAFLEYGFTPPLLTVPFQFNPLQLARSRSLSFAAPNERFLDGDGAVAERPQALRRLQLDEPDLLAIRDRQQVTVEPETISFEIRLDATDRLDEGDALAAEFGIGPQLAALELMVQPRGDRPLVAALNTLLGKAEGYSYTRATNPPLVLFIWGRRRILPVNITSMQITETEFGVNLSPTRATVAVSMAVIEGKNAPHSFSRTAQEALAALNLSRVASVADVVIPG